MAMLAKYLILLGLLNSASTCFTKKDIIMKEIHIIEEVQLSIPGITVPDKRLRREPLKLAKGSLTSHLNGTDDNCNTFFPGITKLNMGTNQYHFATNLFEEEPIHSPIFVWTCPLNATEMNPKPEQIHNIYEEPSETTLEWKYGLNDFIQKSFLHKVCTKMQNSVYANLQMDNLNDTVLTRIFYFVVQNKFVTMKDSLEPHPQLLKAYSDLPDTFVGNELPFLQFIESFGTDYYTNAVFGGCFMLVTFNNGLPDDALGEMELDTKVSDVIKHFQNQSPKLVHTFVVARGGDFKFSKTIREWTKSVHTEPVIISGKLNPLHHLIEGRNANTTKGQSFLLARDNVRQNTELKKLITRIKLTKDKSEIAKYLLTTLQHELSFVLPDKPVWDVAETLVKQNLNFKKYYVECEQQEVMNGTEIMKTTKVFFLIKGVCSSVLNYLPKCNRIHAKLARSDCINFFTDAECKGQGHPFTTDNIQKPTFSFNHYVSFQLCD